MDFAVTKTDEYGRMTFDFSSKTPVKLEGIQKLVQMVLLKILKSPGQDIMSPDTGGGILTILQGNVNENTSEVLAELSPAIKKVEQEIIEEQSGQELPDSEKLQRLNPASIEVDDQDFTSYNMTIEIINAEEDLAFAVVDSSLFDGRQ